MEAEWITASEAAIITGKHRNTILHHAYRGHIGARQTRTGMWLIHLPTLREYYAGQERKTPDEEWCNEQ